MRTTDRRAVGWTALALTSAVLIVWLTTWVTERALNLAGYSLLAEEDERIRQLEERRLRTLRRIQTRREVVTAVMNGRMTLPEAAGVFRELNRELPSPFWAAFSHT